MKYPAQGVEWLAELCRETLQKGNIEYTGDSQRGLDHGAWIPLMLASGAITHNLRELLPPGSSPEPWAEFFSAWVEKKLTRGLSADLLAYCHAPHARRAYPTAEHFEPLFVAFGAGEERHATLLHRSFSYGNLAMDIYAFGDPTQLSGKRVQCPALHASAVSGSIEMLSEINFIEP